MLALACPIEEVTLWEGLLYLTWGFETHWFGIDGLYGLQQTARDKVTHSFMELRYVTAQVQLNWIF